MDFSHNNCGGACIKAGKKEWVRLLWFLPDVYQEWESNEIKFRELHGDYTILTENRKGVKLNLSLTELRNRFEKHFTETNRTLDNFNKLEIYKILKDVEYDTGCKFCDAMA